MTITNPCETATIDPDNTFEIGNIASYIYEPAATFTVEAPYDSVGTSSDGVYYCGNHEFELQGIVPDWLTIQSTDDHSATLAI